MFKHSISKEVSPAASTHNLLGSKKSTRNNNKNFKHGGEKLVATEKSNEIKISCKNLWKVYGSHPEKYFKDDEHINNPKRFHKKLKDNGLFPAVCDFTFDVKVGEIFMIMGLSGSGKSTVLRCISRLIESTAGQILIDNEDFLQLSEKDLIDVRRHKMGMVFQHFGLLPHLSVYENIEFPLKLQGLRPSECKERVLRVIELVGLQGKEKNLPRQLSGGQQQRVGIARSLASEPEYWFLDEPFSALDPLIRKQMQDEFLRLQKMLNKTIVFITHDIMEAMRLGDRIAIMKDGWLAQVGTPKEIIANPANEYVEKFTREVSKTKIIRAGDLIESKENISDLSNIKSTVPFDTTLEDLLCHFSDPNEHIGISDDEGNLVGNISLASVLKVLTGCKK